MLTSADMLNGRVVVDGYVFEGEDVANVRAYWRTNRPLIGWRTTNKARAQKQLARCFKLRQFTRMGPDFHWGGN